MKNNQNWRPSKYIEKNGRLMGSRNSNQLSVSSRLISDIVADFYSRYVNEHCRGLLLDLGCGDVPLYGVYRDLVDDNICVDWPNTLHGNAFIDCQCDLAEDLPFGNNSFDTIILSSVLEHLPDPIKIWSEMGRVLKPGGKLLLDVPYYYWIHESPYDYYRYSEFALIRLATLTGFEILYLDRLGGVPEILADLLAKSLHRMRFLGKPSAIMVQHAAEALLKFGPVKRFAVSTAVQFPLGYFVVAQKRIADSHTFR